MEVELSIEDLDALHGIEKGLYGFDDCIIHGTNADKETGWIGLDTGVIKRIYRTGDMMAVMELEIDFNLREISLAGILGEHKVISEVHKQQIESVDTEKIKANMRNIITITSERKY